jgi:hypothetical protein
MLISTFELLVKRQLPKTVRDSSGNPVPVATSPLSRPVVQGYFLSIANTTSDEAALILEFKAVTATVDLTGITATLLDKDGSNDIGDVIPDVPNAYKFPFVG